jgi:CHAD domain-containing protein
MRRLAQKLERIVEHLRHAEEESSRTAARNWRWAVDAQVAGRASRLSLAMADAGAMYLPERLHTVRIAVKKLRYAFELATDLAGEKSGAELRVLKRAQDGLGRMHDLQILIDRVREVQAALAPPNVTVWRDLDALGVTLEDDCRVLHARYMRLRDDIAAIADRLSARPQAMATPRAQTTRRAG